MATKQYLTFFGPKMGWRVKLSIDLSSGWPKASHKLYPSQVELNAMSKPAFGITKGRPEMRQEAACAEPGDKKGPGDTSRPPIMAARLQITKEVACAVPERAGESTWRCQKGGMRHLMVTRWLPGGVKIVATWPSCRLDPA